MTSKVEQTLKSPYGFLGFTILLLYLYQWPHAWVLSGAPLLQFLVLLGDHKNSRVLPTFYLWPLFTTYNLIYAISATSWLLYWVFAWATHISIILVSLFQFETASDFARRCLRRVLKDLMFIDDKIAFFNIPALEIDTEVDGLMVLRGITFSLSTLSFVVHGVEVGIKLSDDMELSIQSERVEVRLFRGVEVGDCFANLKGGVWEMTFGELEGKGKGEGGEQVFVEGTPLLKAASREGDRRSLDEDRDLGREGKEVKMKDKMTDGKEPEDSEVKEGMRDMRKLKPDDKEAKGRYEKTIQFINETNAIYEARMKVQQLMKRKEKEGEETAFDIEDHNSVRAAICSRLHTKPSVPHPPSRSIKVTTLQNLSPPRVRRFLHRLPMLLRLLLNPLSYFHPVTINSITATASGEWINSLLLTKIFHTPPSSPSSTEFSTDSPSTTPTTSDSETSSSKSKSKNSNPPSLSTLKTRLSTYLSSANFALELGPITGLAQVPFISSYPILCSLTFDDVMAFRSLPHDLSPEQVVRLGGADARFEVPSFLLPHHEHLLPALPTREDKKEMEEKVEDADGKPKMVIAEKELEQKEKDETNVKVTIHARLPAVFDQQLLDFIATIVKASKIVEMEEETSIMDEEVHGITDFFGKVGGGMKKGVKKGFVRGVVSERWVSRLVGKVARKLEGARGEVGYSGDIPVELGVYRGNGEGEGEGEKILP